MCGAEQVIEKWRVGEMGDEQGCECVSRETRGGVWNMCSGRRWEAKRTGNGEVECGGIVGMNRGQVGVSIEQRSECVIHDGLGSRGTGEVYELLIG